MPNTDLQSIQTTLISHHAIPLHSPEYQNHQGKSNQHLPIHNTIKTRMIPATCPDLIQPESGLLVARQEHKEKRSAMKLEESIVSSILVGVFLTMHVSCKTTNESKLNETPTDKVQNPIPAGDKFKPVVQLQITKADGKTGICSGTFITPQILITAAHCVNHQGSGMAQVDYQDAQGNRYSGKPYAWDLYDPNIKATTSILYKDLAAVAFDNEIAPAVAEIAKESPDVGSVVTMVGFGKTDPGDPSSMGTKNYGQNTIHSKKKGLFIFKNTAEEMADPTPGSNSLISGGDSGGALFNEKGEYIGVTNNSFRSNGEGRMAAVDINTIQSQQFSKNAIKSFCTP